MKDLELTNDEIRLLLAGLSWMEGEAGGDVRIDKLKAYLRKVLES